MRTHPLVTASSLAALALAGCMGTATGGEDDSSTAATPLSTLPRPGSQSPTTKLSVPATIVKLGLQRDPYVLAGYLDVTHYGADPTGHKDSTVAFQQAIDDASGSPTGTGGNTMVVYVPPGTYLVSSTLDAVQTYGVNNSRYGANARYGGLLAPSLVGNPEHRPTLKLIDGARGFSDATHPQPIVRLVNTPTAGRTGCAGQWQNATAGCWDVLFNAVVRDVNVVTGRNPGAIGIQFYSAQKSYMQNVAVDATGGFAGIEGAPATEVWTNIAVQGGQYGVMIDSTGGANAIAGLTLSGQTAAGIDFVNDVGDLAVTGFDIQETSTSATGVTMTARIAQGTTLSMIDGTIVVTGDVQPAIANLGGNSIYLENTFIQAASREMILNTNSTLVPATGRLQHVVEYAHADLHTNRPNTSYKYPLACQIVLDGVEQQADVGPTLGSGAAPSDLVSRHVPRMPWAFDGNVAWVTDFGADPTGYTDSTATLQKAINAAHSAGSDEVFLPRGNYAISGTLHLFPNTKFFGLPGLYSGLQAFGWVTGKTLQPFLQVGDAIHEAAASKAGTAIVSDIGFFMPTDATQFPQYAAMLPHDGAGYDPTDQTYLYAIDWQTGPNSVLNQINVGFQYTTLKVPSPANRNYIQVDGDGGGRWYGLQIGGDWGPNGPNGYSLLVSGTSSPLTLYGSNPEHSSGRSFYGFKNASNIRVLGLKMESGSNKYLVEIEHSSNIMLSGFTGHGEFTVAYGSDSTHLNFNTFTYFTSPGPDQAAVMDLDTGKSFSFADAYALIHVGTFNEAVFP